MLDSSAATGGPTSPARGTAQVAGRSGNAETRILSPERSPDLVYFSSASENTHRFVSRLEMPSARIPLRPRIEGRLRVSRPYVLIVPTYGGGERSGAVPRQTAEFLNDPVNRSLLRGVIASGNTNFGEHYCLAGPIISAKCGVPELYRFELLGTARDVSRVREGLIVFWERSRSTQGPDGWPAAHRPTSRHSP